MRSKKIIFSPRLFLGTLLQIYYDALKEDFYKRIGFEVTEEERGFFLREFNSLLAQDLFFLELSSWFRDMLLGRDYSDEVLGDLVYEFLKLKEQLRKQVEIPLLDQLKKLCQYYEELFEEGDLSKKEEAKEKDKQIIRLYRFFKVKENIEDSKKIDILERAEGVLNKLCPQECQRVRFFKIDYLEKEKKFYNYLQKLIKETKIS